MGIKGKRIDVTASEMMELRNQGYSNHDIAKMLDIGISTVVRYIGKQGRRMERLTAFEDKPINTAQTTVTHTDIYSPKPLKESYALCDSITAEIDHGAELLTITTDFGQICVDYARARELARFLVWASDKCKPRGGGEDGEKQIP